MQRVELHAKSKYGLDYDSVIDVEALLWNVKENGEKGIVIADKDSIMAFPKIEKIYHKLRLEDSSFKDFKIGYGVQITSIVEESEQEIVILVKNQNGLKNLYKIMSLYFSNFKNKIPFSELLKYRQGLLIGLILNNTNKYLDLSLFDYIEINQSLDISNIDKSKTIIFSNQPNSFFSEDIKALEVLYFRKNLNRIPECRLYLNTDEALQVCSDENIVIRNSNLIFDNLERIVINDEKFHMTHLDNFDEFASLVRTCFQKKYKNSSFKNEKRVERIERELNFIKELDYTFYFKTLCDITNYCKDYNEYYQLDGYINNSLVAYVLDIIEIEPNDLPCELFFSEAPNIVLRLSPKFYQEKLSPFIHQQFQSKLLKRGYGYKLSNGIILSTIKRYEQSTNKKLNLSEKDYICNLLNQVVLEKLCSDDSYFIIPDNKEIEDFTSYEAVIRDENIKYNHFDSIDLADNLLRINFLLDKDMEFISNLENITKTNIPICNDTRVCDLFRNTEQFSLNFKILDRTTGLLNIKYFDTKEIERRLKRIPNLWVGDLIDVIAKVENLIIADDLYHLLRKRNLDDAAIFHVMNSLKEMEKTVISKATLINKVRISYMQMYYKLYFPKEYYKEMLDNSDFEYVDDKMFSYDINALEKRYLELNSKDRLWMTVNEHQELGLLEILLEMYERNINFKLEKRKVVVE